MAGGICGSMDLQMLIMPEIWTSTYRLLRPSYFKEGRPPDAARSSQ